MMRATWFVLVLMGGVASARAQAPASTLTIVHHQPEGVEQTPPAISVTFDQPMIPVAAVGELAKSTAAPIRVEPEIPGSWKWQGTTTIVLTPKTRLQFGTRYKVTVPATTRSFAGQQLARDFVYSFDTPLPTVVSVQPGSGQTEVGLEPPILLWFNQRVNAEAVAPFVRLTSSAGAPIALRGVPRSTWKNDPRFAGYAANQGATGAIFVPTQPLKPNTTYQLSVRAGVVSDEGPLPSTKPFAATFTTYPPFAVRSLQCGDCNAWTNQSVTSCQVGSALCVMFNHPLKIHKLAGAVTVSPLPKGFAARVNGAALQLDGTYLADKTYRVEIAAGINDSYGQGLAQPWSQSVPIAHLPTTIEPLVEAEALIESRGRLTLPLRLVNAETLAVTAYRLNDAQLSEARVAVENSVGSDAFTAALAQLKSARVVAWEARPGLPADVARTYDLSLKTLVAQHGAGTYLLTIDKAERALLVQLTDLGITARYDSDQMVVLVTSIATGRPQPGVSVYVLAPAGPAQPAVRTGADGVAVLKALPHGDKSAISDLFVIARGSGSGAATDHSYVHATSYGDDGRALSLNWGHTSLPPYHRAFFYPDRDLYRPGETVHLYGVDRQYAGGHADHLGVPTERAPIAWTATSARNRELAKGTVTPTRFGTFYVTFTIPMTTDLGPITIATPLGSSQVKVEEYRAPEFAVAVTLPLPPLMFGDALQATIAGTYLFGAPMKNADVQWTLYAMATRFAPANHREFHFGSAIERSRYEERMGRYEAGPEPMLSGHGKLDAQGRLRVTAALPKNATELDPQTLLFEAQVTDASRQAAAGQATRLGHRADRYLGVRLADAIVEVNRPAPLEVVLVDLDGHRVAGVPLAARASMTEFTPESGVDEEGHATTQSVSRAVAVKPCAATSADVAQRCVLTFPKAGTYLVELTAVDSKQRAVVTRTYVDVVGKDRTAKDTKAERVEVSFARASYQPGDTAVVTVRAPFADGVALITQERRGLVAHQVIKISGYRGTAKIVLTEEQVPSLDVTATAIMARGADRPRAAWATGGGTLAVAPDTKRLQVTVQPAKTTARPGEKIAITVRVADARGRPVIATVSLVAVDESVLGMTGFATPEALPFFHYAREPGVALAAILKHLLPETPKLTPGAPDKRGLADDAKEMAAERAAGPTARPVVVGRAAPQAGVRRSFLTTPVATVVVTDERGVATFALPLPDNLTRFRIMAVASDAGDRFGSGESGIAVHKPLQLRASVPRFANTADTFLAGVLVDNQDTQAGTAEIALAVSGVELADPAAAKKTVALAAGETKEVTFAVKAPVAGAATLRYTARLGAESDAVEVTLPIHEPTSTEAFATYGTTLDQAQQAVAVPSDVFPRVGGLSITLSSSALSGLADAAKYLLDYPYGCVEQVSSRAMPLLVMGELVAQLKLGSEATLATGRAHAAILIDKLVTGQRSDGGWGTWWSSTEEGRPDLTAYVLLLLRRGQEAGFPIPADTVERASTFLTAWMERHPPGDTKLPAGQRRWTHDVHAFALYVLGDWGQAHAPHAVRLYPFADDMDLFARGMLAAVFHRLNPTGKERTALYRELQNRVIQTASSVRFQEEQSEALQLLMHSSSRTDAIVLLVLLEIDPQSVLIPKIVRGLMDARVNGRWDTTQSSAYALYALSRYFKVYESDKVAFAVRVSLGKQLLGERQFAEKTLRQEHLDVPMATLQASVPAQTNVPLTLIKTGSGRLYYRVGLRYAPHNPKLAALDQGFTVSRHYESIANNDDVQLQKDGSYAIKAGAIVRVRLEVVVQDRRFYVAVDDALPAGLELVNGDYKTTARSATSDSRNGDWPFAYPSWRFVHRELRDDRSLHFADELEPGTYQLNVIARATVRGDYVVPPARAEEMYHPEVFGRGATDRVSIK